MNVKKEFFWALLTIILLSMNSFPAASQPGCFNGWIHEKETDYSLEGVNVILIDFSNDGALIDTARTLFDGYYDICPKTSGTKYVFVWAPGFSPERRSIEVTDQEQKMDFQLVRSAILQGVILNSLGEAVEGAHVSIEYTDSIDFPFAPEIVGGVLDSKKDGLFLIRNVEPVRSVRLSVS